MTERPAVGEPPPEDSLAQRVRRDIERIVPGPPGLGRALGRLTATMILVLHPMAVAVASRIGRRR